MNRYALTHLSDRSLLHDLATLLSRDREVTALLLAHLAEVDSRRLYLPAAYPSMFAYCVGELRLSEDAAAKRIQVARAARRFPAIFDAIADGRLHLSGAAMLVPHLTEETAAGLLAAAAHRRRSEIERLIAERFPRPDLPTLVRAISPAGPAPGAAEHAPGHVDHAQVVANKELVGGASAGSGASSDLAPGASGAGDASSHGDSAPLFASGAASSPGTPTHDDRAPLLATNVASAPVTPASGSPTMPFTSQHTPAHISPPPRARLAPVAPGRFALQVTIGAHTHERLVRARALLAHQVPSGDLAEILDRALESLVAGLEKRKLAAVSKPRVARANPSPGSRHVPAHVRRAVWERDGGRCTFVSAAGKRCEARSFLEFDHVLEVARGGTATVSGIRLRCRAHNQHAAEGTFGAGFMRRRRCESVARRESPPPVAGAARQ